jgi:PAS domain S-box-containing protein
MQLPSDPPDFRAYFESAPGMFLVLRPDFVIVAVSDAYLRATMTKREEILGRGLFEVFPDNPDDAHANGEKTLRSSLETVLATRAPHTMAVQKYDIRKPESEGGAFEARYWSPVNSPLLGPDGAVTGIIHRVEDVTEFIRLKQEGNALDKVTEELRTRAGEMEAEIYRRAQEIQTANARLRDLQTELEARVESRTAALRASEDRLAKLAASGIVGIVIADVRGGLVEVNDAFVEMVGYSREELLSKGFDGSLLTPPEWAAANAAAAEQIAARGVALPWEKELLRKDGTRVPVLIGVTMLDHPYCLNVIADLSARKRAEAALQNTEEQLRQSQKMDAIGKLAGGLAHDFNNLLSVVVSYADLMLVDLPANDPLRSDATEIRSAGQRAAELTQQLLAFSRRQVLAPRVLDLNETLTQTGRMLARVLGEHVQLKVAPGPYLHKVKVDPGQVEQVILNLVLNARDAMPSGGQLTIETSNVVLDESYAQAHQGMTPGRHVMLAITDSGMGMTKETQERIFEPFYTTKEHGKGTGLGLSMVYGIVKQSGGSIWLYSEVGRGTTFKIYFPSTTETEGDDAAPSVVVPTLRGTETILVVEDELQVRVVVRNILSRHGYQVLEAANADEATSFCDRFSGTIHLVLTDVVMPKTSGRQLVERLAPQRSEMKVLYMSGYTDNTVVHHGVLDPGIDFLQKPITPETLTRKLREVLDRKR